MRNMPALIEMTSFDFFWGGGSATLILEKTPPPSQADFQSLICCLITMRVMHLFRPFWRYALHIDGIPGVTVWIWYP